MVNYSLKGRRGSGLKAWIIFISTIIVLLIVLSYVYPNKDKIINNNKKEYNYKKMKKIEIMKVSLYDINDDGLVDEISVWIINNLNKTINITKICINHLENKNKVRCEYINVSVNPRSAKIITVDIGLVPSAVGYIAGDEYVLRVYTAEGYQDEYRFSIYW